MGLWLGESKSIMDGEMRGVIMCLFAGVTSLNVIASGGTWQMLWTPSVVPAWRDFGNYTIHYPSLDASAQVVWNSYVGRGKMLAGVCSSAQGNSREQSKTAIFGIPKEYELFKLSSSWTKLGTYGNNDYYGLTQFYDNEVPSCYNVGYEHNSVKFSGGTFIIQASMVGQSLVPGNYKYEIPVKYGHFENKSVKSSEIPGWVLSALESGGATLYLKMNVNVVSDCVYSFPTNISLSHGVMSIMNADGNVAEPYYLKIACSVPTQVSFELVNKDVPCGNGLCEVRLNENKSSLVNEVGAEGTVVSIKSTYRKGANETGGSFIGNAVLSINIL